MHKKDGPLDPHKDAPVICTLTREQFDQVKGHWGFQDFDPVRFYEANSP